MFLRNHWYTAAWSDELGTEPLALTMLNEDVLLYRKQDETPVALENRCAHRRVPLSKGKIVGDEIQCGYHGLIYDCSGACVKIPGQVRVPKGTCVKSYPVVERHAFIYVWMGNPGDADESLIIEFPCLDDPDWGVTKLHLNIKANYLLLIDNLLDLSHVAYLHNTTIGNTPVAENADVVHERHGDMLRVTREMIDVPAARTYAEFGTHPGNFDRWQLAEWHPPAYFLINNGSEGTGLRKPGQYRVFDQGEWGFQVYHGITPETAVSTHQFWAIAYELSAVPKKGRPEFHRQCHQVIWEDVGIYEAQQRGLDSDPEGATPQNVNSKVAISFDQGLLQARKVIDRLLKEEAKGRKTRTKGKKSKKKEVKSRPMLQAAE